MSGAARELPQEGGASDGLIGLGEAGRQVAASWQSFAGVS